MNGLILVFDVGMHRKLRILTGQRFKSNNIMPMETFTELTGVKEDAKDVAFRPELVEIGTEPVEKEGYLTLKGRVIVSLPHGNILRYAVMCGGHQIDVDVLFTKGTLLENNADVYLSFKKDDCIFL